MDNNTIHDLHIGQGAGTHQDEDIQVAGIPSPVFLIVAGVLGNGGADLSIRQLHGAVYAPYQ